MRFVCEYKNVIKGTLTEFVLSKKDVLVYGTYHGGMKAFQMLFNEQ